MFHGLYNLTSQMISENRNMNVISNNMVNITTPGYKKDTFVATTFREALLYQQNHKSEKRTQIGTTQMMRTGKLTTTNYTQGGFQVTDEPFDFALGSSGFFKIQKADESIVYTRNGSFYMDDDGYLALQGVGRVLDTNDQPIYLGRDDITADNKGNIFDEAGDYHGQIGVFDFDNYEALSKNDNGTYTIEEDPTLVKATIQWKALETSNVSAIEEMTNMMSGQRALQSAAQILKMYDQLNSKIVSEIGKL